MALSEEQKWNNFIEFTEKRIQNASLPEGENGCRAGCWWSYSDYENLFQSVYDNESIELMSIKLQRSRSSIEAKLCSLNLAMYADIKNHLKKVFNRKLIWSGTFSIHRFKLPKNINKYKLRNIIIKIGFEDTNSVYFKGIYKIPERNPEVIIGNFITAKERKEKSND